MAATLRELADQFGCELHGADRVVAGVGTLSGAGADEVTFLANPVYRKQLAHTHAAAVVLEEKHRAACPVAALVHPQPYLTYARIAAYLCPAPIAVAGVAPSAVVAASARVAPSAEIGAHAVIGAGCAIADGAIVGPGCVLGSNVVVGARSRLVARVTVLDGVRIGARCIVQPGAVIGADGFGFAPDAGTWVKIPQLGSVLIGDDVEIGANTCVDRGTIDDTVIEEGVKLDNFVQIAHNVHVGAHTIMAAMSGAAGSTKIGKRCMLAGGAVAINQISLCDDVIIMFRGVVTKSIHKPGVYSSALPVDEVGRWRRNAARFKKLDSLAERLSAAERALGITGKAKEEQTDD